MGTPATAAYEAVYAAGTNLDEPPAPFVDDIILTAGAASIGNGLYIGCGNGRNYVPLVTAGLDLVGVDISETAIAQLAGRMPDRRQRLIVGDLKALPTTDTFSLVVGILVFQHGDRAGTHAFLVNALDRVASGGLFAVQVNAVGDDLPYAHEVVERDTDGSFSVRYTDGSKTGLTIHYWAAKELESAIASAGFRPVLRLRPFATWRQPPLSGLRMHWEGIYRRW